MAERSVRPLDQETWSDFERLVEANNGVWGGCWCTWYHDQDLIADDTPETKRRVKACLVENGRAHASLVFEGQEEVGGDAHGASEADRLAGETVE